MKRSVSLLLCLALCLWVVGCGKQAAPAAEHSKTPTISVFEADVPVAPETEPEDAEDILAQRRNVVEQHMRYMSTVRWTIDEDITYSYEGLAAGNATEKSTITLQAGHIYQGIPYTHGSGSAYSFLDYAVAQDENGVYRFEGLNQEAVDGISRTAEKKVSRVGNDCADMVYWAWAQVATSISFENTIHMTPSYGCMQVGEYVWNEVIMQTPTTTICEENGQQTMFDAYAQLQKGDAVVQVAGEGGGHAAMIVETHVERIGNTIQDDKSYVTVLEQTPAAERSGQTIQDAETGEDIFLCEVVDKKWSFRELYRKGYLPITCKELVDPSPLPKAEVKDTVTEPSLETLFSGSITGNYRIASVAITLWNADGQPVQRSVCHPDEKQTFQFNLASFKMDWEQPVLVGKLDVEGLTPGTYRCTYDCRVSTGESFTFRDFTFTV